MISYIVHRLDQPGLDFEFIWKLQIYLSSFYFYTPSKISSLKGVLLLEKLSKDSFDRFYVQLIQRMNFDKIIKG